MTGFKHGSDERNAIEYQLLMLDYGALGYGRYMILLEALCAARRNQINITRPKAYEALGRMMFCSASDAQKFINDCICYDLIESDGTYISSPVLKVKEEQEKEKAEKRSSAAKARWQVDPSLVVKEQKEYKAIEDAYVEKYKEVSNGVEPVIPYARTRAVLKRLMATYDAEIIKRAIVAGFSDRWVREKGAYSLENLLSSNILNRTLRMAVEGAHGEWKSSCIEDIDGVLFG